MQDILRFDYSRAVSWINSKEMDRMATAVRQAHKGLHKGTGIGAEYLGWLDLPEKYDRYEFERIKQASQKVRSDSDVLVVVGIGGSYLGARAAIEMLNHSFYNLLPGEKRKGPQILFAGQNLSASYLTHLIHLLENKNVSLNVVSKSGTTLEPAIAFRLLRDWMEARYGKQDACRRIYATTDRERGALKKLADEEGYQTFVVPDDIGGRYSVLSAVGLFPMAAAGIDIDEVMRGAGDALRRYAETEMSENECYQYAAVRNVLYSQGKTIEILAHYEPSLRYVAEWWKQLFGESEGKGGKGIFPASVDFSTDLHSLGQWIQEGPRHLFETVLRVEETTELLRIDMAEGNPDGLNFLAGKTIEEINRKAFEGTMLAHTDGGVPNLTVTLRELSPYSFGWLIYFFEKACALSGYILCVNPFNQPGVEAYKKNMFALLGKPGFEKEKAVLESRLNNHSIS